MSHEELLSTESVRETIGPRLYHWKDDDRRQIEGVRQRGVAVLEDVLDPFEHPRVVDRPSRVGQVERLYTS